MTEAEDHPPEGFHLIYPDSQFLLRSRAAEALRRLGNAFVRHRISDSELETLTEWADIAVSNFERSDPIARPTDYFYQTEVSDEIQDESTNDYSAFDCSRFILKTDILCLFLLVLCSMVGDPK
jgi:hypothetical protein